MRFGLPLSLWILAVAVLAFVPKTESITEAEKTAIGDGLAAGKEIFDLIKEQNFKRVLTKIVATNIKGFLGSLGPFVGFALAFVPSAESPEMEFLRNMMKKIDTHFDRVDSRFNDVEQLIKWTQTAVQFGEIQTALKALKEEYRLFYTIEAPAKDRKYVFRKSYEGNYNLAGTRLYQAIITPGGYFNENLGKAVMRYTKNDRKKTNVFLLGILDMILQGMRLENGYYKMMAFEGIRKGREEEWGKRIEKLRLKYIEIDHDVRDEYLAQSREDILGYARDNIGMSSGQFSSGVYDLLNNKFYWRVWFVLIYNPITGSDNHRMKVCGGHILLRQYDRNIVIASKDNATEKMNMEQAYRELIKFTNMGPTAIYYGDNKLSNPHNAEEYYDKADKTFACSFAVIPISESESYKPSDRVSSPRVAVRDFFLFKMFVFG